MKVTIRFARLGLAAVTMWSLSNGVCLAQTQSLSIVGWGSTNNDSGQYVGEIYPPAGLSNVVSIAAGGSHSMALLADGTMVGWGDNGYGQATVPGGLTNLIGISAGYYHSLALKSDGTVAAWGSNISGETNIPGGLSNVIAVAAGGCDCFPNGDHSLALKSDGSVVGWGTNASTTLSNFIALAAGDNHSLGLRHDGTIAGWGFNYNGQATPLSGISNVVAISAGGYHSMVLQADGTVFAWGNNYYGQTNVPPGLTNVAAISAGEDFSSALLSDGTVVAWGSDIAGESEVPAGLSNIVAISAGARFVLALQNNGAPTIVRQPLGWTFYTGTQPYVVLSAGVVGPKTMTLQWQCNGTNVTGATNSYLEFNNAQPENSGNYTLVATDQNTGTATSSNAVLTVIRSQPIILTDLTNSYGLLGGNATLSVSATGSAPIFYKWQFNGTNILNATNSTLTLTNLSATNGGYYSLILSNTVGAISSSTNTLSVLTADLATALNPALVWTSIGSPWFPETTFTHDGIDASQSGAPGPGGSSTMQTTVVGPGTLTFWWTFSPQTTPANTLQFSSSPINSSAAVHSTSGWQQNTFYIGAGLQTLTWKYTQFSFGTQSTGVVDEVNFVPGGTAPTISSNSPNAFVRANSNVGFSVSAYGTPPLYYQWQFNGTNLLNKTNASLSLNSVQSANSGIYSVTITNDFGSAATNATLWVGKFAVSTNSFMSPIGFQLTLDGLMTTNPIVILGSTDMVNWSPLFTNSATTGSVQYLDITATNLPARFYKAQE